MSIFAVVPVKSVLKSKSRLSIVLDLQERQTLVLTMLEDVLRVLKLSKIGQVCVISSDQSVQTLASNFEVTYLLENQVGLNQAVQQAVEWCIQNDAESVFVLPADIPLITRKDVDQIVELGSEETGIVISPSENGGTNALFQKPPNLIPSCFGLHSFMKHVNEARAMGIAIRFYCSNRVALDIDSVDDLRAFLDIKSQTMARRFLEKIRLRNRLMDF